MKSTKGLAPRSFLSEGERQFSVGHADLFTLAVVTGVDVATGSCDQIRWVDGAISETCRMQVTHWRGALRPGVGTN